MMFCKLAWGNVRRSARDFALYFVTLVFGVSVFYAFNSISSQQSVLSLREGSGALLELLGMVISGVSVFVAVILAFLVVYADRFLARRRKREFAVYLTLGMPRGQLARLLALETGMVGTLSLSVGLAIGFLLSQALTLVTASFFGADVPGFALVFSTSALCKTLVCFILVFLLTIVLDSGMIMRSRLIDLLHASKTNERIKLRSIPAAFFLFVLACVLIGASYRLLLDTGLLSLSPEFVLATVLVCIGTVLFFYAISGFLLRAFQWCRPLYLRGLAMFTLRQLDARVNTTFLSMSVVCLTLFLALTSVSGGIGICNALQNNLSKSTAYDASASTAWYLYRDEPSEGDGGPDPSPWIAFAQSVGYDMERGLSESAEKLGTTSWDAVVERSVQVDFLTSTTLTYGSLDTLAGQTLLDAAGGLVSPGYESQPLVYLALSDYNAALELAGQDPVDLGENECMLVSDYEMTRPWIEKAAASGAVVDVEGSSLTLVGSVGDACLETTSVPMQPGALVVPDEALPESLALYRSILDVDFVDDNPDADRQFRSLMEQVSDATDPSTWPLTVSLTRVEVWEQSMGLTAIVGYLAVYVGFVLVIASAAILAIQQLSAASDNAKRYAMLAKLGASSRQTACSVVVQVGICFAFPLALAAAHTLCALQVVADAVEAFGHLDITAAAGMTAVAFLALYGLYFLLTCWGGLGMAQASRR